MTLLSVMIYITVFVIFAMLTRTGLLHLLVWIKPNDFVRLNFVDTDGNQRSKDIQIGKDADSKELIEILKNVNMDKENAHKKEGM